MLTVEANGTIDILSAPGVVVLSKERFTKFFASLRNIVKRDSERPSKENIEPVLSSTIAISTYWFAPAVATETA